MNPDLCEICGEKSKKTIICDACIKMYKITEDKACHNCDFGKEGNCIITNEKVDQNYYCLFFMNRSKNGRV